MAQGSFKVNVQDTTAPTFTAFPGNQTLIAANINGAVLDLGSPTIEAKDDGPDGPDDEVSPPVDISCTIGGSDANGYLIAIGQTVAVECTATDNSQYPSPNSSVASFDVFVGLDLSCVARVRATAPHVGALQHSQAGLHHSAQVRSALLRGGCASPRTWPAGYAWS